MKTKCLALFLFLSSMLSASADTVTYFEAVLTSGTVVAGGVAGTSSTGTGLATFVLTEPDVGEPTLSYHFAFDSADLDGTQTGALDDNVTAIHIHDTNVCVSGTCIPGDTAGTKHILNVFGAPREDDADMTFDATAGTVSGLWDASDENALSPAPSGKPGDFLTELFAGEVYVMAHTQTAPAGAYGGFLVEVPEPMSVVLFATAGLGLIGVRRRR